jgi:hypothetical protein
MGFEIDDDRSIDGMIFHIKRDWNPQSQFEITLIFPLEGRQ